MHLKREGSLYCKYLIRNVDSFILCVSALFKKEQSQAAIYFVYTEYYYM